MSTVFPIDWIEVKGRSGVHRSVPAKNILNMGFDGHVGEIIGTIRIPVDYTPPGIVEGYLTLIDNCANILKIPPEKLTAGNSNLKIIVLENNSHDSYPPAVSYSRDRIYDSANKTYPEFKEILEKYLSDAAHIGEYFSKRPILLEYNEKYGNRNDFEALVTYPMMTVAENLIELTKKYPNSIGFSGPDDLEIKEYLKKYADPGKDVLAYTGIHLEENIGDRRGSLLDKIFSPNKKELGLEWGQIIFFKSK